MRALATALVAFVATSCATAPRGGPRPRALAPVDRLLRGGQGSAAAVAAARILVSTRRADVARGAALILRATAPTPLPAETVERLARHYRGGAPLLGRRERELLGERIAISLLRAGAVRRAGAILARLPDDPRRLYLRAMIRTRGGELEVAATLLANAGRLARGALGALVALARARVAAERGRLAVAVGHYAAVSVGSAHFFAARQELSWIHLRRADPAAALAQLAILDAPRWRRRWHPDRPLVAALALLQLCRYAEARRYARLSAAHLARQTNKLSLFLRDRADVRLYYVEATARIAGRGSGFPRELGGALLADASFRRVLLWLRRLQRERRALHRAGNTSLHGRLHRQLERRLVRAQQLAGETVRKVLAAAQAELSALRLRSEELLVELDRRSERASPAGAKQAAPAARLERGRSRWPFNGEYWIDEVPHLRVRVSSYCRRSSSGPSPASPRPRPAPRRTPTRRAP